MIIEGKMELGVGIVFQKLHYIPPFTILRLHNITGHDKNGRKTYKTERNANKDQARRASREIRKQYFTARLLGSIIPSFLVRIQS